jgi:hypothetical protein
LGLQRTSSANEALDEVQWHAHAISLVELGADEARLPYFLFS